MIDKKVRRLRRSRRARGQIERLGVTPRLSVHRSHTHMYAQLLSPCGGKVLVQASTLEKAVRSDGKYAGNKEAAAKIGKVIAERALKAGISDVAFDRSGFKYHGRVRALAEAAREAGLKF